MGLVITSVHELSPRWHAQAQEVISARLGQIRAHAIAHAAAVARPEPARRPERGRAHHRPPAARHDASWYLDASTTSRPRSPSWRL